MHRLITIGVVLVGLAAASQSSAAVLKFRFPLTVSQAVPEPTINLTPDTLEPAGVATITVGGTYDWLTWDIDYAGLTGPLVSARLHGNAGFGETAQVREVISGPAGVAGKLKGSTLWASSNGYRLARGHYYLVLTTEQNPEGEIRGQVIPEPAGAALLGLGSLFLLRRRR